jgi:hypothetical protein
MASAEHAEIAEEGGEGQLLPPREFRDVARAVQRNVDAAELGEIFRQSAERRDLEIPAPIAPQLDVQDTHFKDVARFGALNMDRSGQEARPRPAKRAFQHLRMSGNDVKAERRIGQIVRLAGEGLDGHAVSGCDLEHRLQPSIPKSPLDVAGNGPKNEVHGRRHLPAVLAAIEEVEVTCLLRTR